MKRSVLCLLAAAFLLLAASGCGSTQPEPSAPTAPFYFYYRCTAPDYETQQSVIQAELRDLGDAAVSAEALITLYLQGPLSEELVSPFPRGTQLRGCSLSGTVLTLRLNEVYGALQGIDASIADACLTQTLLGLSEVRRVRILAVDADGVTVHDVELEEDDIVLSDAGDDSDVLELTLYFADSEGRFLLTEKRSIPHLEQSALPQYVLEQLFEGPQTAGLYPTIPVGTVLLDLNVENGICAVDLSAAFVANRSDVGIPPHLTLMSIVNTLTELKQIELVQFYIEGSPAASFGSIPLEQSFSAENRIVGPIHPELSEYSAVLCLPLRGTEQLYPLSLRLRSSSSESQEEALLRALYTYAPQNGLENPLSGLPQPQWVSTVNGTCTVNCEDASVYGQTAEETMLHVRILVASLTALPGIDRVVLTVNGEPLAQEGLPLSLPEAPQGDWYVEPPL